MTPQTRMTAVRLPADERERLEQLSVEQGKSITDLIREGIGHLDLVASGAAGLPLGDRDESWSASDAESTVATWASSDGSGDPDKIDWGKYGQAFFWHDDNPSAKGDFKLGFAKNANGLHAVWAGVTAVAAVLQGSRGGVQGISDDDRNAIKGKVAAYYAAAAKKYADDSITPPWEASADGADLCADDVEAAAHLESMTDDEWHSFAGRFEIELGDPADATMQALAEVADSINHCPDYGECYFNAETGDVWWEACDGDPYPAQDGDPAGTSFDDITSRFMAVDGVKSVTIEAENMPPDDGSYVQVPQSQIADGETDTGDEGESADGAPYALQLADGRRLLGFSTGALLAPPEVEEGAEAEQLADGAEAPTETPDAPPLVDPAAVGGGSPFRALLAIEGTPTDDGRMIAEGALTWRELPLTLMAMIEEPEMGGHAGSQVAGRIDEITRQGNEVWATGYFDSGDFGTEIARLVKEKMLRGVSIDLAVREYEERWGDDVEGGVEDPFMGQQYLMIVTDGVIMGSTVCPFPAFAEAGITVTASAVLDVRRETEGDDTYVSAITMLGTFDVQDGGTVPPAAGGGGSLMIALYPEEADAIADPDGNIPAEALHVTLFAKLSGDADTVAGIVDDFVQGAGQLSGTVAGAAFFAAEAPGEEGEPAEAPDSDDAPPGAGAPTPADGQASATGRSVAASLRAPLALANGQSASASLKEKDGTITAAVGDATDVPQVLLVDAPGLGEMRFDLADALEAAGITYAEDHDFLAHITTDYDDPADQAHNQSLIGQPLTFKAISIIDSDGSRQDVPLSGSVTASAAGLAPDLPPLAWFDFPHDVEGVDQGAIVPFTVTRDGRVYGYAALFNECHMGQPGGRCTPAPHHYQGERGKPCEVCGSTRAWAHSQSWYDYFHLGQVETAEGEMVNVGQITVGKPHADLNMSVKQVMEHYDDVRAAVADVRMYETPIGVMCAGALRPEASTQQVRQLRAAKLSGDWRSIKGSHELLGCQAVNVPGYPVPRVSQRVKQFGDDRRIVALVAAGMVPDELPQLDRKAELEQLVKRAKMPQLLARARNR